MTARANILGSIQMPNIRLQAFRYAITSKHLDHREQSIYAGLGLAPSLWLEPITKGHGFQLDPHSVLDGDHGACLEYKCR